MDSENIAAIARGLSSGAKLALAEGCACGDGPELVLAGLWEPEFPPEQHPELRQEYFKITPLGLAVRQHLLAAAGDAP